MEEKLEGIEAGLESAKPEAKSAETKPEDAKQESGGIEAKPEDTKQEPESAAAKPEGVEQKAEHEDIKAKPKDAKQELRPENAETRPEDAKREAESTETKLQSTKQEVRSTEAKPEAEEIEAECEKAEKTSELGSSKAKPEGTGDNGKRKKGKLSRKKIAGYMQLAAAFILIVISVRLFLNTRGTRLLYVSVATGRVSRFYWIFSAAALILILTGAVTLRRSPKKLSEPQGKTKENPTQNKDFE